MTRHLLLCHCLLANACLFDGELKRDTGVVPERRSDGWAIDTPENVGLSSRALERIHEQLLREDRYRGTLSFLVVKDGKLVFETYLRKRSDQSAYRHVQSVTKSVTSLLLGIAMDRGYFEALTLTLGELFPKQTEGLSAKKRGISLEQLLTMRSGLSFDNEVFATEMWVDQPSEPLRYILDKPLYADPGEKFYYRDADPQLVGYALSERLGTSERRFAAETLFAALEIRDYYWEDGPDGVSMAAHGLHLLPRDLAKLGQLVLDAGVWRGEQVVSAEWLREATRAHVATEVRAAGEVVSYGYYWWLVPGLGYTMWGHGGQFVFVAPERSMVLVQTAFPDTDLPDSELPDFMRLVQTLFEAQ